jgi:3-phytase/alkaline phosphatase D
LINNLTYQLGPGKAQLPTSSFEVVTGSVAYDAPFGPTVLDLAADVPVGSKSLLDTFLASLGLPNRTAFDTLLTPVQKNEALRGLIDSQVTPLGYSKLGLEDSGLDATFVTGGPVAAFTYGWTQFDITPGADELRITTYGIEAYQQNQVNADLLLRTPKVINQLVVRSERPVLSFTRAGGNLNLSWDASFVGYQLESSPSIGAGAVWSPVTSSVSGTQRVATIPLSTASGSFMRLRQP